MVLAMAVDASLITSTSVRHASGMAAVKLPFGLKGKNLIRLPDPFLVFTLHPSIQGASKPSNLEIHCSNVGGASHVNNGESDFRKKQDSSFQFNLFSSAPGPIPHQDMKLDISDGANNRGNDVDPRRIFRTTGSRSIPSRSSIPGRYSKYSDKVKGRGGPMKSRSLVTLPVPAQLQTPLVPPPSIELLKESVSRAFTTLTPSTDEPNVSTANANANENAVAGASYSQVDLRRRKVCYPPAPPPPPSLIPQELPFEFQYSYTEVPKVAPLGYREPQFSPFGPEGVERPWTGRPPLPKSKKPVRGVDSFKPPPPGKKGVKTVCQPGPFPEGQGPRYVRTREEILGDPLTPEEVKSLVESVYKEKRQINLGRDGLTHNMLNDVHNHWRRRRVVKVKCKGVPTVDMDNVCFHLEDKTGGKIIHRSGGVVILFRGRNYNTRLRPQFPLMLWKPAAPIYPRLIQATPGGLTWEEAMEMRKRGSKVKPLTKLGKNGVYLNLVRHVREAFEVDELVRIDCTGLNPSDYKKIGAKLRDLVPCVLLSFEREQILIWRGHDWKSSSDTAIDEKNTLPLEHLSTVEEDAALYAGSDSEDEQSEEGLDTIERLADSDSDDDQSIKSVEGETCIQNEVSCRDQASNERIGQAAVAVPPQDDELEALWQQAATSGLLVSLDDNSLDADSVHKKVSLLVVGESVQTTNAEDVVKSHESSSLAGAVEDQDKNSKASLTAGEGKKASDTSKRDSSLPSMRELSALDVQPQEGLPVDELAKLLSM